MENFSKEGRKLRPRKNAGASAPRAERVEINSERVSFGDRPRSRSFGDTEHRSYGEGRPSGERRSYGGSEHRGYGEGRPSGERRSYGESRPGSDRRSYGASRPSGERRSYGSSEHRSYGEGRPSSERRSYGESRLGSERRSYGEGRPSGERRSYGESRPQRNASNRPTGKKPVGFAGKAKPAAKKAKNTRKPNPFMFNKNSDAGINRMISRRPVVNESDYSDADVVPNTIKDEIRLNRFIANSGICSRREADTLIAAGVVTVNGEVVTELGTKVNIHDDDIRFNGERLKGEEKVYIVMNKPSGYVTTASDPHAGKTVIDLVKNCSTRVYPVGRLDKNTTGVLMLTNDGEIAERLTHPSYDKKKIYQVILDKALEQEDYDKILTGLTLSDGDVKADELEYIDEGDKRKLGIEIHSGKNRIVRRIFESLGYNVKALDRVYFAGLTKKGLKKGEWRYLTEGEVNILKMGAYI